MTRIKRVSTVLARARALIADPKHWTQRWYARDKRNRRVKATASDATQWCAAGAIQAVVPTNDLFYAAYRVLDDQFGFPTTFVNDRRDREKAHAAILSGYDAAIKAARREERAK